MKKCKFCSEEIQDDAKKCRYCGEWLEGVVADIKKQITPQKINNSWIKFKKFFVKPIIILILLLFLAFILGNLLMMRNGDKIILKESECLNLHPLASAKNGSIVSQHGKELAEKTFKENKCTEDDLNIDYKKTEMNDRVDNCRRSKRDIDTYNYIQCVKK